MWGTKNPPGRAVCSARGFTTYLYARFLFPAELGVWQELLRHEAGEVGVGEREDEKLIRVLDHLAGRVGLGDERVGDRRQEIVVVRDIQRMVHHAVDYNVLAEGDAFELRGDEFAVDAGGGELGHDVEEGRRRFRHCERREVATLVADVNGAVEVDEIQFFHYRRARGVGQQRLIAHAFAVALVDQKLMAVYREDLAHARAVGELVGVLMRGPVARVDRHDAETPDRVLLVVRLPYGPEPDAG